MPVGSRPSVVGRQPAASSQQPVTLRARGRERSRESLQVGDTDSRARKQHLGGLRGEDGQQNERSESEGTRRARARGQERRGRARQGRTPEQFSQSVSRSVDR